MIDLPLAFPSHVIDRVECPQHSRLTIRLNNPEKLVVLWIFRYKSSAGIDILADGNGLVVLRNLSGSTSKPSVLMAIGIISVVSRLRVYVRLRRGLGRL